MIYLLAGVLAAWMGASSLPADPAISGDYVEARTAEIFTGGCIMGSEGEVSGREALMAWRVRHGRYNDVPLDGLSVVAMVSGDVNLGTHELGGLAPSAIRTLMFVDARATSAQQQALVQLARSLAPDVVRGIAATRLTAIEFETAGDSVRISAGAARLSIETNVEHSPACGALRWFEPLARVDRAQVGLTRSFEWSGAGLGSHWTQIDRRSSYVGSFTVER